MKLRHLVLLLSCLLSETAFCQSLVAGDTSTSFYYKHIPDSLVFQFSSAFSQGVFPLDLDRDGVSDIQLHVKTPGLALGGDNYKIQILTMNHCKVAVNPELDSCFMNNGNYSYSSRMVRSFSSGEIISTNTAWDTNAYIIRKNAMLNNFNCLSIIDTSGTIGFKLIVGEKTRFLWLKIASFKMNPYDSYLKMGTVAYNEDFSTSSLASEIPLKFDFFLSYESGQHYLNTSFLDPCEIIVTDVTGRVIHSQFRNLPSGILRLDNISSGIYLVSLKAGGRSITKKFLINSGN